jgi:hypothetical protein
MYSYFFALQAKKIASSYSAAAVVVDSRNLSSPGSYKRIILIKTANNIHLLLD